MSIKVLIILGIIAVVLALLIAIIYFLKNYPNVEVREFNVITFQNIIDYFHSPEIIHKLQSNSDLIACVVRKNAESKELLLCLYSKSKSKIDDCCMVYKGNEIDLSIKQMFDDHNMIIVK